MRYSGGVVHVPFAPSRVSARAHNPFTLFPSDKMALFSGHYQGITLPRHRLRGPPSLTFLGTLRRHRLRARFYFKMKCELVSIGLASIFSAHRVVRGTCLLPTPKARRGRKCESAKVKILGERTQVLVFTPHAHVTSWAAFRAFCVCAFALAFAFVFGIALLPF